MSTAYSFVTAWEIDAPIEPVWEAILHSEHWPQWWRGVLAVTELEAGEPGGLGNLRRYTFRGRLPYTLGFDARVTRIEAPHALDAAAEGDLVGEGRWRLRAEGARTLVRYEWDVCTTRAWMDWIAPLARPLFTWNHDVIMRWGEQGLRRHLSTPTS